MSMRVVSPGWGAYNPAMVKQQMRGLHLGMPGVGFHAQEF